MTVDGLTVPKSATFRLSRAREHLEILKRIAFETVDAFPSLHLGSMLRSQPCLNSTASSCLILPYVVTAARFEGAAHSSEQLRSAFSLPHAGRQHRFPRRTRLRLVPRAEDAAYGATWNVPKDSYLVLVPIPAPSFPAQAPSSAGISPL